MGKFTDVKVDLEGKKWVCRAYTHNTWSDMYMSDAKTREKAIKKVIENVKKDSDDLWLLPQLEKLLASTD